MCSDGLTQHPSSERPGHAEHTESAVLSDVITAARPTVSEIATMSDADLEAGLLDLERSVNMLQAAQADVMVALATRARQVDASLPATVAHLANRRDEAVVDEIAATLPAPGRRPRTDTTLPAEQLGTRH